MYVQLVDVLLPQHLAYGFIDFLLLELSHFCICFGAINAQIVNDMYLWVRKGVWGFSNDSFLVAVAVGCSKVLLQFLHCLGKLFGSSWPKVKDVDFQVSAPSLEIGLGLRIRDWVF